VWLSESIMSRACCIPLSICSTSSRTLAVVRGVSTPRAVSWSRRRAPSIVYRSTQSSCLICCMSAISLGRYRRRLFGPLAGRNWENCCSQKWSTCGLMARSLLTSPIV